MFDHEQKAGALRAHGPDPNRAQAAQATQAHTAARLAIDGAADISQLRRALLIYGTAGNPARVERKLNA